MVLAVGDQSADACGCIEGRNSGAAGAQSFRKSALGAEFELEFTGKVLSFEFTIFAYVTGDHFADLVLLEQQAKAPVVNACVIADNYQVLPAQGTQRENKIIGNSAKSEAADSKRHTVFK
jgi:hypothetical protein